MIIKTIDIPFTGQPLVRLLDDKLTKTASNDIQEYWNSLEKSPKYAYLHVLAMTDSNHYGPNNNGDWFNEEDLKKYHNTFCSDAHIYLHHINKDPARSIGRPIYSFYNDNMHRVELILAVEKNNPLAVDTIGKIKRGEQLYVSMGCKVPYDICSLCGHQSKTRLEYCDCLKFDMKKIMPDGRQVYAINPPPLKFFDISIVTRPADRVAWALDKMACENAPAFSQEHIMLQQNKDELFKEVLSHEINKFSEILKTVDGEVLDYKDLNQPLIDKLKFIRSMPEAEMDLPEYQGSAPIGTLIRISISKGIPPTWGEIGRSLNCDYAQMLGGLRGATELFRHNPLSLVQVLKDVLATDDHKEHKDIEIVMTKRAEMFKKAKLPLYQGRVDDPLAYRWGDTFPFLPTAKYVPGSTTPIIAHDDYGNVYKTNRYNAIENRSAAMAVDVVRNIIPAAMTAAGIGIILSGLSPQKLVAGAALTLLGIGTANMGADKHVGVDVPLHGEVSSKTFFTKSAFNMRIGDAAAVALPTFLAADYFINKKIRHKDNPYYREQQGTISRIADKAGEVVTNHPFTTVGSSLILKGLGHAALKSLMHK